METAQVDRRQSAGLLVACAVGLLHAVVSCYWAAGGSWLVDTLGTALVARFADVRWLLFGVAAVKVIGAGVPVWLNARGWPHRAGWRPLCWTGAVVLVAWGGLTTVVGQAVLSGVIDPAGGYDRPAMLGHAFLWDPLFLLWGVALAVGLRRTRSRRPPAAGQPPVTNRLCG